MEDVYVIGGGPSLKCFPWNDLRSLNTIAVNMAMRDVPSATYALTADSRFVRKAVRNGFWGSPAQRILIMRSDHKSYRMVKRHLGAWDRIIPPVRFDGEIGFTEEEFATGQNSGFCGMQFAVILGAKRIHLLGFDLHCNQGQHYHNDYPVGHKFFDEYFFHFVTGIKRLTQAGIEVISYSKDSRLNDYVEYVSWKDAMTCQAGCQ